MSLAATKASWQRQLIDAITDVAELLALLQLPADNTYKSIHSFPLRVPQSFIQRMEPGNRRDPLLLQVLPDQHELISTPGYSYDPLGEKKANKQPGLLHKYHGRVLLLLTTGCAVNCRYCFRRHFPYSDNRFSQKQLHHLLQYIKDDPSISEVILSGGDPLLLKDDSLAELMQTLSQISHLKYVRIHTRLPIVIPDRITNTLIDTLTTSRFRTSLVIHTNHPHEINGEVTTALLKFQTTPIQLFNQAVLLKDINDDAQTLVTLSYKLYDSGVLPYYLHLLDPVQNTAHFAVSEARGHEIMQVLREQLPGYLVPKFVKEIAEAKYKIPINAPNTGGF